MRFSGQNLPDSNNRRILPSSAIICSDIDRAKAKLRHSMIDQEYLLYKIEEWKKADNFLPCFTKLKRKYKWKKKMSQIHFFLCVNQSDKSISFNGSELILLDATYKTTRYSLPLFFLTAETNVDYPENETIQAITEALAIIKSWNPEVFLKYGMTDYCNEETDAVECVFSGLFLRLTTTKSGNLMLRYFNFEPSFRLRWCCVVVEIY